jgi:hypothetical protein
VIDGLPITGGRCSPRRRVLPEQLSQRGFLGLDLQFVDHDDESHQHADVAQALQPDRPAAQRDQQPQVHRIARFAEDAGLHERGCRVRLERIDGRFGGTKLPDCTAGDQDGHCRQRNRDYQGMGYRNGIGQFTVRDAPHRNAEKQENYRRRDFVFQ